MTMTTIPRRMSSDLPTGLPSQRLLWLVPCAASVTRNTFGHGHLGPQETDQRIYNTKARSHSQRAISVRWGRHLIFRVGWGNMRHIHWQKGMGMRTKLSAYCDKVMEAGWLLVIIIVPLFFDVYSSRVFEPDKLGLLRSIAALMAVAWLIKWAEERVGGTNARKEGMRQKLDRFLRFPLVLPTLVTAVVYLLTTAMSVVPRMSWRGSYVRLQGAHTTRSNCGVFGRQ